MPITHALVSILPDGSNTDQVQPSDWNADHTGASAIVEDRPPSNGEQPFYTVDYQGATGGSATWLVNGLETAGIAFDADGTTIIAAVEAADPSLVGLVNATGFPVATVTFDLATVPVTLTIGTDSTTGGGGAIVDGDEGTALDVADEGTRWVNTDDEDTWTNYGGSNPWSKDGDVTDPLSENLGGDNLFGISDVTGVVVTSLALGGSGLYADEYNVPGTDGSPGAAIISGATDPTSGAGYSPDYVQGTLFLFNPNDAGVTPGAVFIKEGDAQGEWGQILTFGNGASLPTANPGPGLLWNDSGTVKVGT